MLCRRHRDEALSASEAFSSMMLLVQAAAGTLVVERIDLTIGSAVEPSREVAA